MQFDIPDKHKRKYQCFVCGVQFTDYFEYKEHILKNHDEGREYIVCPLKRCGAPVRDMRMHFKVKHPHDNVNKIHKGPMRALIWKDHGGKKTRKPKFRKGKHLSTKMNKYFSYDSGWEKTVLELLDEDTTVKSYEAQPFQIDYINQGQVHKYTPDMYITFVDEHVEVWEVKPSNQTAIRKNKDKWFYAEEACKVRGWGFEVITEQGIEQLKKKVRNQNLRPGN
jgi:hypothetical protein